MRPDFVSAEGTPNLWKLAQRGVTFAHHHPVYLSSTEVNGTAIATGAYPSRSTVIANVDFRPRIDPQLPVGDPGGRWSQYLQISELNGVRYLDEGNGAFEALGGPPR